MKADVYDNKDDDRARLQFIKDNRLEENGVVDLDTLELDILSLPDIQLGGE